MPQYHSRAGLQIADPLLKLIEQEIIPNTGINTEDMWQGFSKLVDDLMPINQALLTKRNDLQAKLDQWHKGNVQNIDLEKYTAFLKEIGYLVDEPETVSITTQDVDPEIATIAGPQLVVPVMNARFALNATNARWGSLYDALYGTDVITNSDKDKEVDGYDPVRGAKVVAYAKAFLDNAVPLDNAALYSEVRAINIDSSISFTLVDGDVVGLKDPNQFVGFQGVKSSPESVLLVNNGLHVDIKIDNEHAIGKTDPASIKDVILEAAITTIQDCEDSVAAVDADDKTLVYRSWLGLMKGDLNETFSKNGNVITRKLSEDRKYYHANGDEFLLSGRSLLLVRNVGHLMTTDSILTAQSKEVPEGIVDCLVTTLCALHDLNKQTESNRNSRTGSMYIVKPKMHGPEEVAFTTELFSRIETLLKLKRNTLKMGIMDEERRTTLNLKACIEQAKERVIFINTGFLDRTGDEIHTGMCAGPVVKKTEMKQELWINAYENWNVDVGLSCGLKGKAQIGKGMWAMPDEMAQMVEDKHVHPESGASCAWVPSPTAAVLHAMHYHDVRVADVQETLMGKQRAVLNDLLSMPIMKNFEIISQNDIQKELDNNAQSILGYVVRWIDQGIGCSKVPDINDIGLMEDRATLRISSQHIANWLKHELCTHDQVEQTMQRMAAIVDEQNKHDVNYKAMCSDLENSLAYQAACDLVFKGLEQPNGYTEPLLHSWRRQAKQHLV